MEENKILTYEELMALFAEIGKKMEQSRAEREKEMAEREKEREKEMAERKKEMAEREKEREKEMAEREKEREKEMAEREKKIAQSREEHDKRIAQQREESDRRIAQQREESDRRIAQHEKEMSEWREKQKESDERFNKKLDRLNEVVNGVSNNIGNHAEQYFQDVFSRKKELGGEKYDKLIRNLKAESKESCEFDIFLVNGQSVAIIEVKNRIHPNFVETVANDKVSQFRKYFPEYKDYKLYLGIAGFSFDDSVIEEAKECGIGIIRQVGDAVEIDDKNLKAY